MDNTTPEVLNKAEAMILKAKMNWENDYSYDFTFFDDDFHDSKIGVINKVYAFIINNGYAKKYNQSRIVYLTEKGIKFKGFKNERRKAWFKNLPSENWFLAKIIESLVSHTIVLMIGILLGWFSHLILASKKMQLKKDKHQLNVDSTSYKRSK